MMHGNSKIGDIFVSNIDIDTCMICQQLYFDMALSCVYEYPQIISLKAYYDTYNLDQLIINAQNKWRNLIFFSDTFG